MALNWWDPLVCAVLSVDLVTVIEVRELISMIYLGCQSIRGVLSFNFNSTYFTPPSSTDNKIQLETLVQ